MFTIFGISFNCTFNHLQFVRQLSQSTQLTTKDSRLHLRDWHDTTGRLDESNYGQRVFGGQAWGKHELVQENFVILHFNDITILNVIKGEFVAGSKDDDVNLIYECGIFENDAVFSKFGEV